MALCRSKDRRVIGSGGRGGTAVGPDGDPLRMDRRRVGLEVTELLLLLGIQPPFTIRLFCASWKLRSLLAIPELLARLDGIARLVQ